MAAPQSGIGYTPSTTGLPFPLKMASVTATPAIIVGNGATDICGSGLPLVAAVPGKTIMPIAVISDYTFGIAAYTGLGSMSVCTNGPGAGCTHTFTNNATVTTLVANRRVFGVPSFTPVSSGYGINSPLIVYSTAQITNPGTATGTITFTVYYYEF